MSVEYMFVVFARERYRAVTCDGTTARSTRLDDNGAIEDYFTTHVWPDLEPRLKADEAGWDDQKRVFVNGTRVTVSERKIGSLGSRVSVQIATITWPDGRSDECPADQRTSRIDSEYTARYGRRPSLLKSVALSAWRERTKPTSAEVRGWTMTTYLPDGSTRNDDVDLGPMEHGAPFAGITKIVNGLAGTGWTVVNIAEDKGLYNGADANLESYPARIRLMLSRTTTT